MALGDVADYLIGLLVERVWPQASLLIFFNALFCLPVDRLAAGGEDDRAESQQASCKVILVILLAKTRAFWCGALRARIPLLRVGIRSPAAAHMHAHTCAKRG